MSKLSRNQSIYECHKIGLPQTVIGKIFCLSQSTVCGILKSMKSGFDKEAKETRGVKSKLSAEQKEALKILLQDAPQDYGFFSWDKWSIQSIILEKFEVSYHENYIWEIMKSIKFSSQRPQPKDYRKDPEKVANFKEQKAPGIKKKRKRKIDE